MFEKLKVKLHRKIANGAIESELDGERVLMKKGGFPKDWYRFYPPVEEIDGKLKWNYFNLIFGGKKNFLRFMALLILISMFFICLYSILNIPCA